MADQETERLLKVIGENTQEIRKEHKLSIEEFAELCRITPERLKKNEAGKLKRLKIIEILRAMYKLNVPAEAILSNT